MQDMLEALKHKASEANYTIATQSKDHMIKTTQNRAKSWQINSKDVLELS